MSMIEPRKTRPPQSRRPQSRRSKARPIALALESAGPAVRLKLAGETVLALPEGALWLEARRALIVSDLHFEKGSAFARRGQMLPPYDTRATLARLAALVEALDPRTVVSLGDSFHDAEGAGRLDRDDASAIRALTRACDWIWIEGNHDPAPPDGLGGRAMAEISFG
ncbi:MAG TPA: metallophosphoesterase, partial [Caulobacterales bacterium]|nr:metallophosphoesterase [Caulobacterales bacterium]